MNARIVHDHGLAATVGPCLFCGKPTRSHLLDVEADVLDHIEQGIGGSMPIMRKARATGRACHECVEARQENTPTSPGSDTTPEAAPTSDGSSAEPRESPDSNRTPTSSASAGRPSRSSSRKRREREGYLTMPQGDD